MADTSVVKRTYPWHTSINGVEITFRLMRTSDRDGILAFARSLPDHDLLFLRIDITDPKIVDEWVDNIEKGRTITIIAESGDEILGYASLHRDDVSWRRHVGEIRVMLKPDLRGFGLGKILANEVFAVAKDLGLQKVMVQMTTDQRGAPDVDRLGDFLQQSYVELRAAAGVAATEAADIAAVETKARPKPRERAAPAKEQPLAADAG